MTSDRSLTRFGIELHSSDRQRREEAARQLWLHFADRLSAVVRHRLDPRLLRRVDVEDVVQSIFVGFFAAVPGPDGPPRSREDLWRLLVHFTMCKVANTADRHRARRRDVFRDQPLAGPPSEAGMAEPADLRLTDPKVWRSPGRSSTGCSPSCRRTSSGSSP